jgi:hypothetical protein
MASLAASRFVVQIIVGLAGRKSQWSAQDLAESRLLAHHFIYVLCVQFSCIHLQTLERITLLCLPVSHWNHYCFQHQLSFLLFTERLDCLLRCHRRLLNCERIGIPYSFRSESPLLLTVERLERFSRNRRALLGCERIRVLYIVERV